MKINSIQSLFFMTGLIVVSFAFRVQIDSFDTNTVKGYCFSCSSEATKAMLVRILSQLNPSATVFDFYY